MDVMDYVPYSGFVQNDEETIAIMTKAATIVPKVCDILGISLSDDSESEDEDTADTPDERSPGEPEARTESPVQDNDKPKLMAANTWSSPQDATTTTSGALAKPGGSTRQGSSRSGPTSASLTCQGPKTPTPTNIASTTEQQTRIQRKRCASTPSSLGQSTSVSNTTTAATETTTSEPSSSTRGETQTGITPPKRRRFPSISLPPSSAISQSNNMSEEEANIRRKMLEDLEVFNNQIRQLAVIEKTKNRLLEKMLFISSAMKNQGRTSPTTATATPANTTNSQQNQ